MTGQPDNTNPQDENKTYTAAQLRMARRKARRLGLNPANGRQAIEMLEERDIKIDDVEPNLMEQKQAGMKTGGQKNLGSNKPDQAAGGLMTNQDPSKNLPAAQVIANNTPAVITKEERQLEIAKLEKKIRQRRDDKMRKMIRRFSLFVLLPTIVAAIYYYVIATPLYGANTEMKVEQASAASTGPSGGLLAGTPFATQNEAIAVQGYLQSRDAFAKLQNDYPFTELFQGDNIDRFRRIAEDANDEQKYKLYKNQVKVSYDNTDQVLRLEVRTPDAVSAKAVSELLLGYAEDQVDASTQRVRDTGVADAQILLDDKAQDLQLAEEEIFAIQELQGTLSPTADKEVLVAQVAELKNQLTQQELTLQQLLSNQSPNQIRVRATKQQISLLQGQIDALTNEGNEVGDSGLSITRLDQQMRIAETKLALAQREYELASQNLQVAKAEARSQRRFIVTTLPPTSTFEPIYPKKILSTLSAFVIFFGIYIIASLTIEVIREQVSA